MRVLVVTNMYPTPETPAFGTFVYDQVEALRREGVNIDVFFFNGRESSWNYLKAYPRYWRQLRRSSYDVIHAHYVFSGIVARAQWGRPVVLTHHGPEVIGYPRWQSWLCKVVTPFFDQVIHVTEEVRAALRDDDGWVIPCGVNLDEFSDIPRDEARRQVGLPPGKPLVLWAGEYWRPVKRFEMVEQAMEKVQQELPNAELVLLSGKPHDVVPVYMAACDAFVLTSDAEGSPMVIKEAMACGLPIVSVPVGDVAEVIQGTDGCSLARRDPQDVADKLVKILRHPRRTDGRAHIQHLRHDRIAQRIIEVYRRALNRRGAAAPDTSFA